MKHILSVSLGSSSRDKSAEVELLGEYFLLERRDADPVIEGRSFATNMMESVFVTLLGKPPSECNPDDYLQLAEQLQWQPTIRELT